MKKYIGIIIIFLLIMATVNPVFAAGELDSIKVGSVSDIKSEADNFINTGEANQTNTINTDNVTSTINWLYGIGLVIGGLVAVVVGIILGIQFMMSASSEEKAKYKKALVVYVVGCVVIFGALGIWRIVTTALTGVL